jgi:hypothetical protein
MHKCLNCGEEFEGNFCPECGTKWRTDKICPECGAVNSTNAKFCTECGCDLFNNIKAGGSTERASRSVASEIGTNTGVTSFLNKVYPYFKYVPAALIALFSLLLFAFYAAPVAVMVGGGGIPDESLGSVYTMSELFGEVAEVKGAVITLIVLAVLSLGFSAVAVLLALKPYYHYIKTVTISKFKFTLNQIMAYVSLVVYLIFFIVGCVICGEIGSLDGGLGIFGSGACPILIIVFSLIFALLTAGVIVSDYFLNKKLPQSTTKERAAKDKFIDEVCAYAATLPAPQKPVAPIKVEKPAAPTEGLYAKLFEKFRSKRDKGFTEDDVRKKLKTKAMTIVGYLCLAAGIFYICCIIGSLIDEYYYVNSLTEIELKYYDITSTSLKDIIKDNFSKSVFDVFFSIGLVILAISIILLVIVAKRRKLAKQIYGVKKIKKDTPTSQTMSDILEEQKIYVAKYTEYANYLEACEQYNQYKSRYPKLCKLYEQGENYNGRKGFEQWQKALSN